MAKAPKISVLVPTYGYGRFLPAALDSILGQEFADFEAIVADDASADGSEEVILAFAGRDERIRAQVHRQRLGMVANWNWCLGEARGEYIKFVFGDDRLASPAALGRMAAMLDAHPGAALAASARLILAEDGAALAVRNEIGSPGLHAGRAVAERALWSGRNLVGGPSCVLFRRRLASRGFDPGLRQIVDLEMWLHLLREGGLAFDSEPLCGLRRHPAQQSEANARLGLGAAESLIVTARYLDILDRSALGWRRRLALRELCHRRLYYARKRPRDHPEAAAMEARLRSRVPRRWAAAFGFWHRLTKPLCNLGRAAHRAGIRLSSAARRARRGQKV